MTGYLAMAPVRSAMIYDLPLRPVGIAVALVLIAGHALALWREAAVRDALRRLPRSRPAGVILLSVAALWAFLLVLTMDLGESAPHRPLIALAVPALFVLALFYVEDFLAARAVGMLLLLAAEPLLDAAFLREPSTRLLLPILAYVWVGLGLFWIGMPYLMRDQIAWVTRTPARWRAAAGLGCLYGVCLLACALAFY